MSDTIDDIKKSRGRPKANSTAVLVRIPPDLLAEVDLVATEYGVTRPEAVRKIIIGWMEYS